jgi:hypothetical protein
LLLKQTQPQGLEAVNADWTVTRHIETISPETVHTGCQTFDQFMILLLNLRENDPRENDGFLKTTDSHSRRFLRHAYTSRFATPP